MYLTAYVYELKDHALIDCSQRSSHKIMPGVVVDMLHEGEGFKSNESRQIKPWGEEKNEPAGDRVAGLSHNSAIWTPSRV